MTAEKRFEHLLKSIEESNLNYSIQKTPFSATISLKCSFVKRFSDSLNKPWQCPQKKEVTENLQFEKLKEQNDVLRKELSELRVKFDEEASRLENLYKSEKGKLKNAEKQIAELREEVLNVKRVKHEISAELKLVRSSVAASEIKVNQLNSEVASAEKVLKDKKILERAKAAEIQVL